MNLKTQLPGANLKESIGSKNNSKSSESDLQRIWNLTQSKCLFRFKYETFDENEKWWNSTSKFQIFDSKRMKNQFKFPEDFEKGINWINWLFEKKQLEKQKQNQLFFLSLVYHTAQSSAPPPVSANLLSWSETKQQSNQLSRVCQFNVTIWQHIRINWSDILHEHKLTSVAWSPPPPPPTSWSETSV